MAQTANENSARGSSIDMDSNPECALLEEQYSNIQKQLLEVAAKQRLLQFVRQTQTSNAYYLQV